MKYNLEDLSDMIACLLTIYEDGIYMPYIKVLDNKYVVFITNIDDIPKYDNSLLLYKDNKLTDEVKIINNDNYPYISDFINYLTDNQNKHMSMCDIICDFLNINYETPKRKIKL